MVTEIEFLKARLDERESEAQSDIDHFGGGLDSRDRWITRLAVRTLADVAAQRKIIEISEEWPILVETQPEFSAETIGDDYVTSISKQIAFITNRKYRETFGDEPPTTPDIRALIQPFADHPDFEESWRS